MGRGACACQLLLLIDLVKRVKEPGLRAGTHPEDAITGFLLFDTQGIRRGWQLVFIVVGT